MEGWQPADVIKNIKADEKFHAGNDWPDVFDFHRPNTPYPEVLRDPATAVVGGCPSKPARDATASAADIITPTARCDEPRVDGEQWQTSSQS